MTRNDNTFFFLDISLMSNCVVSSNTKLLHFFCFLLLHLLLSFLSPCHYSFSASFFFFLFFVLPFFTSIASSFFLSLLFSTLHIDAFVGFIVLFYGFIWFWISGFGLGLCKGGRDGGRIFVHGLCVCAVVGLKVGIGGFGLLVVVGGGVAPALASAPAKCSSFG